MQDLEEAKAGFCQKHHEIQCVKKKLIEEWKATPKVSFKYVGRGAT
jgi:hypothetical protein